MKILLVCQWWPPEPARMIPALAEELVSAGHDVHVVTGYPNYPSGVLHPGYRIRWRQRETMGRTSVTRVPLYPSHDRSTIGRIANYVTFGLAAATIGVFSTPRCDVAYVYHPPITSAWAGLVARYLRRTPYVLHIQDMWPDSVTDSGMVPTGRAGRIIRRTLDLMCRAAYRGASRIVVIAPGMKDILVARGVDPDKVSVVYNWCDDDVFQPHPPDPEFRHQMGWDGKRVVLYAGNFGDYQGLDRAVHAAARLARDTNIHLALIGNGIARDRIIALVDELGAPNITVHDRVEPEQMHQFHSGTDFHLVTLVDLPFFAATIPGKTQIALATGKPVIAAVRGDAADLVMQANAGITADPTVDGIEHALRTAADLSADEVNAMGQRGREFYETNLTLHHGAHHFETELANCARSDKRVSNP